jgi:Skp family chaperone for outer membrane proteins
MKHRISKFSLALATAFALPVMVVAPIYAQHGADDTTGSSSSSNTSTSSQAEVETHNSTNEVKNRVQSFNDKAKLEVADLKKKQETEKKHTEQERKKSCEARSAELTKKLNKKVADAEKHKAVFDKIYTRVKTFHDDKKLDTVNYDALVAKADAAQADAAASIATLKSFDTSVDCTQVDAVATKVAAFRDALKSTRTSLKAYRSSIKDLIVAVKASIPATTTSTSTDSSTSTTNTTGN